MSHAIVAGSSSGIGRAICKRLFDLNKSVLGLARDHSKFQPETDLYTTHQIDFSKIEPLEASLKTLLSQMDDLELIVCSAGYGIFKNVEEFSAAEMENLLHVNFLGQAILIKTFLPLLKRKRGGKIIVIASECALKGSRSASMYAASKFALRGFCQSLRDECKSANVAVTVINPGLVNTPFFDKLGFKPGEATQNSIQPEQVAEQVIGVIQTKNNCVVEEINLQPMSSAVGSVK